MTCKALFLARESCGSLICDFSDDSWHIFMKRFAASVQHITGQELEVRTASDNDSTNVIVQELEALRIQVEDLSDEVRLT